MRGIRLFILAFGICGIVATVSFAAAEGDSVSEKIVSLARSGNNREAIKMYEALPADSVQSLRVMRAVAGCYWREKDFEKSRELYKKILDQRPTLQNMSDKPRVEKPAKVSHRVAGGDSGVISANAVRSREQEAEIEKLRAANRQLQEERDRLRRETEARIAKITEAAVGSSRDESGLQEKLQQERDKRIAAEKVSQQIQGSLERQKQELEKQIAELEKSLKEAREKAAALQASRGGDIARLQKELAKEKRAREELKKSLDERVKYTRAASQETAALSKQLEEARDRLAKAQKAADKMRAEMERQRAASDSKIVELEATLQRSRGEIAKMQKANRDEIAELRKELEKAKAERDSLSKNASKQLAAVSETAEKSVKRVKKLEAELAKSRAALNAAEGEKSKLQQEFDRQERDAAAKVSELEKSLKAARDKTAILTEDWKAEVSKLERDLAAARAAKDALKKKTDKQLADLTQLADMSSKDSERLQRELEQAQAKLKESQAREAQLQKSMVDQGKAAADKIAELEQSLKAAQESYKAREAKEKARVAELEKSLGAEKAARVQLEKSSKEIQQGLEKSNAELQDKVAKLQSQLKERDAQVAKIRADAAGQIQNSEKRSAELEKKIAELEAQARSVKYDMASLERSLEAARLENAKLNAKRSAAEEKTAKQMKTEADRALELALREIDRMEREYHELDMQTSARQDELLARVDKLEKSAVVDKEALREARDQLKLERKLRQELEARNDSQSEKLLDANRVLAEATEKMAKYFDQFREEAAGDKSGKAAVKVAPMIGKMEEVTRSAKLEVESLNAMLGEERRRHQEDLRKSHEEINNLKREVAQLKQQLEDARRQAAEQKARWEAEVASRVEKARSDLAASSQQALADAQQKLSELDSHYKAQLADLNKEVAGLRSRIAKANHDLAVARQEAAEARRQYTELQKSRGGKSVVRRATGKKGPEGVPSARSKPLKKPAVVNKSGGKVVNARSDAECQMIIELAARDKDQAISKFEKLPSDAPKPLELLKVIANAYRDRQEYNKAYSLYSEILKQDPDNSYAERKLVMTLFDLGRYDEALARLSEKQKGAEGSGRSR